MEIKNFTITKRDGSKDQFSLDKIMNAIVKAFESVNEHADLATVSKILNHLDMHLYFFFAYLNTSSRMEAFFFFMSLPLLVCKKD